MKELLKELCLTDGISGDEGAVRDLIISKVKDCCQYSVDDLGNLICFRKGRKSPKKKLMICAHMDEVGFMITYMSREQREKAPSVDSLYIDIGAASKEEAEKYVSLGDCVYYDSEFTELGEHCVKSKAIDDRAGCAIMIKLMQEKPDYDTYFVFNVQEEIGLRGSAVSSFSVAPDFAIVLEATTAADIDGVTGEKRVCELGRGPVVSFMDRRTIYDKELYKLAIDLATCQTKTMIAGGNDAGAIHISGKGVRTISVSVPCRYLHSPSSVIDMSDLISSYKLVKNLSKRIPLL